MLKIKKHTLYRELHYFERKHWELEVASSLMCVNPSLAQTFAFGATPLGEDEKADPRLPNKKTDKFLVLKMGCQPKSITQSSRCIAFGVVHRNTSSGDNNGLIRSCQDAELRAIK